MAFHRFQGTVLNQATLLAVPDVIVELLDFEHIYPGLIAVAKTDACGAFEMTVTDETVQAIFGDRYPVGAFRVVQGLDVLATDAKLQWHLRGDGMSRILTGAALTRLPQLADYIVAGRVVHAETGAVAGRDVRLFDRNLSRDGITETPLSSPPLLTDACGRFRFAYRPASKVAADLVVRAYDPYPEVAAEVTICQAPPFAEVEIVSAGSTYCGLTEYSRARTRVLAVLGPADMAIRDVDPSQEAFLACTTGLSTDVVTALVAAAKMAAENPPVDEEVFYGLVRLGLPSTRPLLLATPLPELGRVLLRAVSAYIICPSIERTIATVMQQLEDAAVLAAFEPRTGARGLGEIVAVTPGITLTQQQALVREALRSTGDAATFWAGIAATFGATLAASLQFTVDSGAVTFNHPALLAYLHTQRPGTISVAEDLARYTEADWLLMLVAQNITPPPETPGTTLADQRASFAAMIARTVEARYRTRYFAERTKAAEPASDLTTFLMNNVLTTALPRFDFETTRVAPFLIDKPSALNGIPAANQPVLIALLKQIGRIFKVTQSYKQAKALLSRDYGSAGQINDKGKNGFIAHVQNPATQPTLDVTEATNIYYAASWVVSAASAMVSLYQPNALPAWQLIPDYSKSSAALPSGIADWPALFGMLNGCQCEQCASFYSPAAYFADLITFLNRQVTGGVSAKTTLFQWRPDLPLLELSCANATKRLPMIDLVNEILEVSLWRQVTDPLPPWPTGTVTTTASEEELIAGPEIVYPTQFNAAYFELANSVYPFILPFHLFVEEARTYLRHLGVPRHELIEILASATPPQAGVTWADWVAAERLGLSVSAPAGPGTSAGSREVIIGSASGASETFWGLPAATWITDLTNVGVFLKKSGLTFDELRELLASRVAAGIAITPSASCDVDQLSLTGLTATNLGVLQRFLRLRKILGWAPLAVDEAVQAFAGVGNAIDGSTLRHLAGLIALRQRVPAPPVWREMLVWWANIDTHPIDDTDAAREWRNSLYRDVFLNRQVLNPTDPTDAVVYGAFFNVLSNPPSPPPLSAYRAHIRASLGASDAELALLLDSPAAETELALPLPDNLGADLTLQNLSRLFRIVSFARALRTSVGDLRILTALAGGNPQQGDQALSAEPDTTLAFLDVLDRFRAAKVTVAEIHYILRHAAAPGSTVAPSETTIAGWIRDTAAIVARAHQSALGIVDPTGDRSDTLLLELGVPVADVATIMGIVGGTLTLPTLYTTVSSQWSFIESKIGYVFENAAEAQGVLAWKPAGGEPEQNEFTRPVPERFAYLAERLECSATSLRELRAWFATTFGIEEAAAKHVLETNLLEATTLAGAAVIRDFVFKAPNPEVPAAAEPDRIAHLIRIDKIARLIRALTLTANELAVLFPATGAAPAGNLPWFSLNELPVDAPAGPAFSDLPAAKARFAAWLRMVDLVRLRDRIKAGPEALFEIFAAAGAAGATVASVRDLVAQRTGWNRADVDVLAGRFGAVSLDDYRNEQGLLKIERAFGAVRKLGVPAAVAIDWVKLDAALPESGAPLPTADQIARDIKKAARGRHDAASWAKVAKPLRDVLREAQRDALVAWQLQKNPTLKDAGDLYKYLLLDVQMSACDRTSRIVQANASIQLFIQRATLGLTPPGVVLDADAVSEWEWMSRYRLWEANRKIYLYPENWIDAELRDDKSPLFKVFETELLQSELTTESAEEAIRNYVRRLMEIANLEVMAVLHAKPPQLFISQYNFPLPQGSQSGSTPEPTTTDNQAEKETLHVFGRTGSPRVYYYRKREGLRWTPWEKLDLDIEGEHLVPVLFEDQLFLFWPLIEVKSEEISKQQVPDNGAVTKPAEFWEMRFAWSVLRKGRWSGKRLSTGILEVRPKGGLGATSLTNLSFIGRQQDSAVVVEAVYTGYWGSLVVGELRYDPCTDTATASPKHPDVWPVIQGPAPPGSTISLDDGKGQLSRNYQRFLTTNGLKLYVPLGSYETYPEVLAQVPAQAGAAEIRIVGDRSKYTLEKQTFIVQDSKRSFLAHRLKKTTDPVPGGGVQYVEPANPSDDWLARSWRFEILSHPYACTFIRQIERRGVSGLLRWSKQSAPIQTSAAAIDTQYAPSPSYTVAPFPNEEVDFSLTGSMSLYNWELFFHAPFRIATGLFRNGRYREARQWLHCIFDPTDRSSDPAPKRYWKFKPFHDNLDLASIQSLVQAVSDNEYVQAMQAWMNGEKGTPGAEKLLAEITAWREDPFNPYAIARMRPVAFQKAVVMLYIDVLLAWADELFTEDSRESIGEATQLYILAANLLGPKPVIIRSTTPPVLKSFVQLEPEIDGLSNAMVEVEGITPPPPVWGWSWDKSLPPPPAVFKQLYFCIPPNDKLLGYWDRVADRLFKIRHCRNIEGVERELPILAPPIDPALLVRAKALGVDLKTVLADIAAGSPKHRYAVLFAKAVDFTNLLISLGSELTSALEKRDSESLARLRQTHELSLLRAVREAKQRQVAEARENLEALRRARATAEARHSYYTTVPRRIEKEGLYAEQVSTSVRQTDNAMQASVAGQFLGMLPDLQTGAAGLGGSPLAIVTVGGLVASRIAGIVSSIHSAQAKIAESHAGMSATEAQWIRRNTEWDFQAQQASLELRQIDTQIAAAEIRVELAEIELKNHDKQIEQSREVGEFLESKFTRTELYDWMVSQVSALHFQAYKLAFDMAKKAERAYVRERGEGEVSIIQFGHWEGQKRGLLAGQRLALDLRRLDAAYLDGAKREYELTKHVALSELDPVALLKLLGKDSCEFSVTEDDYDDDFTTHYLRRLKSVAVNAAHVAQPWDSIQMKLTLTSSKVRPKANADIEPDSGFVESIVTSSGQADTGLFETNLRDERLLPFEGAGAISKWTLELPGETNRFDRRSLTDVVLSVRYTARDGSEGNSRLADMQTRMGQPAGLRKRRLVHVRRDLRDAFTEFFVPQNGNHLLAIPLPRISFTRMLGKPGITVTETLIYIRKGIDAPPTSMMVSVPVQGETPWSFSLDEETKLFKGEPAMQAEWPAGDSTAITIRVAAGGVTAGMIDEIWVVLKYKGTDTP